MTTRWIAATLTTLALTAGGVAMAAAPASAAPPPKCFDSDFKKVGAFFVEVPLSADRSINFTLRSGDRNPAVSALQSSLVGCNNKANLPVTGFYGSQTKAAVIRIQRAAGITADGIYGPATRRAMTFFGVTDPGSRIGCVRLT